MDSAENSALYYATTEVSEAEDGVHQPEWGEEKSGAEGGVKPQLVASVCPR